MGIFFSSQFLHIVISWKSTHPQIINGPRGPRRCPFRIWRKYRWRVCVCHTVGPWYKKGAGGKQTCSDLKGGAQQRTKILYPSQIFSKISFKRISLKTTIAWILKPLLKRKRPEHCHRTASKFNPYTPGQNARDFADDIFRCIWNLFRGVQFTISQHCFR